MANYLLAFNVLIFLQHLAIAGICLAELLGNDVFGGTSWIIYMSFVYFAIIMQTFATFTYTKQQTSDQTVRTAMKEWEASFDYAALHWFADLLFGLLLLAYFLDKRDTTPSPIFQKGGAIGLVLQWNATMTYALIVFWVAEMIGFVRAAREHTLRHQDKKTTENVPLVKRDASTKADWGDL